MRWGLENPDFAPTLDELIDQLETNPKQFPPKTGKLAGTRAAEVFYREDTWRLIFDLDDEYLEVTILAIGPHDVAYRQAQRRR